MSEIVNDILTVQSQMEATRAVFQSHWQECAERVWPDRATFLAKRPEGDKRNEKIFDATATLALNRFASAMESVVTPRGQRWHTLALPLSKGADYAVDPDVYDPDTQAWLEHVTSILFHLRYGPGANFASQQNECYMSMGAFGNSVMLIEDLPGSGVLYRAIHLAECFFLEDFAGKVNWLHRKFELTAKQAVEKFGAKDLPEKIRNAYEKEPGRKFEFIHCVKPSAGGRFRFDSWYISTADKADIGYGGFYTFPYVIGRYITTPGETYARGPAMMVLPEIKMVNEMSKTYLRAAHLAVQPPLMLPEDGVLQSFDMRPGALNFGGVDSQGNQTVKPLVTGAQLDVAVESLNERRKVINDAFLITLFQILIDKPYMSATEALLRAQEKGQLLAPTMGRFQSETLGPLIEREVDILQRNGLLPPPPQQVLEQGGIKVEYVSPLNLMMKAQDAVGIQRTLESITPIAQLDPTVLDAFHPERMARILADANGAPARAFRTPEELEEKKAERAGMEQAQAALAAAPVVTSSIKNMADAQKSAAESPPMLPGPVPAGA